MMRKAIIILAVGALTACGGPEASSGPQDRRGDGHAPKVAPVDRGTADAAAAGRQAEGAAVLTNDPPAADKGHLLEPGDPAYVIMPAREITLMKQLAKCEIAASGRVRPAKVDADLKRVLLASIGRSDEALVECHVRRGVAG